MNELAQVRSHIHTSIVKSALATFQIGSDMNELTQERSHTYTCKHCTKCFSQSSNCKQHERTRTGEKPYTCKHCKKCFSQSPSCKKHEKRHTRASSLKQKEHDHCLKPRRDFQEQAATLGDKKSCMLSSITEENSSQVESLTCWICLKEVSSEAYVIQHYDEHK